VTRESTTRDGAPAAPTNTEPRPLTIEMAEIQQVIGGLYLQLELLRRQNAELQQKLAAWEARR
jgi:hypothetical protein